MTSWRKTLLATLALIPVLLLQACGSLPSKDGAPDSRDIPSGMNDQAEPVPGNEPLSQSGNPSRYEVFGKTYYVLPSSKGYHEQGIASWYGRKFQGRKTANGEIYDMFKLTAAHKTLPLPSYVRVTNLANGKNVVVRVNDRGPFHGNRIIDLSYAAAARLDLLSGVGMVQIDALDPEKMPPPTPGPAVSDADKPYLQVGAYGDPINAISTREELNRIGVPAVEIRSESRDGKPLHRVLVGPFDNSQDRDQWSARLAQNGWSSHPVQD